MQVISAWHQALPVNPHLQQVLPIHVVTAPPDTETITINMTIPQYTHNTSINKFALSYHTMVNGVIIITHQYQEGQLSWNCLHLNKIHITINILGLLLAVHFTS